MTLYGLIASLAWAALAAFVVSRADAAVHRWLSITERRTPLLTTDEPIEIPPDLNALAMGETEQWAQDSVLAVIRERWNALKDWNRVRAAMGIGGIEA